MMTEMTSVSVTIFVLKSLFFVKFRNSITAEILRLSFTYQSNLIGAKFPIQSRGYRVQAKFINSIFRNFK